jgi:hypothetical protein
MLRGGGITAREAKRQREQTAREWDRERRAKARADLARLRQNIAHAKAGQREAIKAVRELCRHRLRDVRAAAVELRAALREQVKAERRELAERIARQRAELRDEIKRALADAKGQCAEDVARAITAGRRDVERALRELAEAREMRDLMFPRRKAGPKRERREIAAEVARRAAERRQEDDDEVRSNIPEELIPVFEKVKRKIKATPYASRTEVFLEWAAEHGETVAEIQNEEIARQLRAWEREERQLAKALKKRGRFVEPMREPGEDDDEPADAIASSADETEIPF